MRQAKIHRRLHGSRWYLHLLARLKKIKVRQKQTTLYHVLGLFFASISHNRLLNQAHAVAFNFTMAIFPSIIFIFTLIPYIHLVVDGIDSASIMSFMASIMPASMYAAAAETIQDIVSIKRQGWLSFGGILALILASNGVHSLMVTFHAIYKTPRKRGFIRTRLIAIGLILMMAGVLFFCIFVMLVGKLGLTYLSEVGYLSASHLTWLNLLKYGVIMMAVFVVISTIYCFAPTIHHRWTFFSTGAIFATISAMATSYVFSFYIDHFDSYNKLYGSLGALIGLMVWLYLLSLILLLGFQYHASTDQAVASADGMKEWEP